ncbi:MAG: nucleotidyltransferase domain-containing protein [Chlorobi bacterium]|nr:nucleotidyltransferase domain-containing protein [Chlorobiota bacterium]
MSHHNIISIAKVKEKTNSIIENFNPEKIILFGSVANGFQNQDSDADILIIIKTNKPTFEIGVEIATYLKHDFPMDIIVKTPEEISQRLKLGDYFIQNILNEGITLYERNNKRMD